MFESDTSNLSLPYNMRGIGEPVACAGAQGIQELRYRRGRSSRYYATPRVAEFTELR
jgi:hypothetical protein